MPKPHALAAPLVALVVALSPLAAAASDVSAGDGIGGVHIGERKQEAIDDRLACRGGGSATGGWIALALWTCAGVRRVKASRSRP